MDSTVTAWWQLGRHRTLNGLEAIARALHSTSWRAGTLHYTAHEGTTRAARGPGVQRCRQPQADLGMFNMLGGRTEASQKGSNKPENIAQQQTFSGLGGPLYCVLQPPWLHHFESLITWWNSARHSLFDILPNYEIWNRPHTTELRCPILQYVLYINVRKFICGSHIFLLKA